MSDKNAEKQMTLDEYQKALHDDYDFLSQPPVAKPPKAKQDATPAHVDDLFDYYEGYWYGNEV